MQRRCVVVLLLALASAAAARAVDRPTFDASYGASPAPRRAAAAVDGAVASYDDRWGTPSFVWAAPGSAPRLAGDPVTAALAHLDRHAAAYGLSPAARAAVVVRRVHDTGRGGIMVVLGQQVDGVDVHAMRLSVLMRRDLSLVALGGSLHPAADAAGAWSGAAGLSPEQALSAAFGDLYGVRPEASSWSAEPVRDAFGGRYALPGEVSRDAGAVRLVDPARAGRTWFAMPGGLVPAYRIELFAAVDGEPTDSYAYVVAASDGTVLRRQSLTDSESFTYRVWADGTAWHTPLAGPQADFSPHPTGTPDSSSPAFIPPVLVSMEGFNTNPSAQADPWLPAGATVTTGNNVDAYADLDAVDGYSAGDLRATVTAPGIFDMVYDTTADPLGSTLQSQAAVVQLFYTTNWLHDYFYDSGFDEAAGNAQADNFGRGGVGGDRMRAEAQDTGGANLNNANMSTPSDGISPRMQMYLWSGPEERTLTADGTPLASGAASFDPVSFDVTANLAAAVDATPPTTDLCQASSGSLAGQIALVDRGGCTFVVKAQNAQTAGAVGVIIANNVAGSPQAMSGSPTVTVPVLSVSLDDGIWLRGQIAGGPVSVHMATSAEPRRDGTIDNGIVAHEWGHYLHRRLVTACGTAQCGAQGEGWGDAVALHTILGDGDDLGGTYSASVYGPKALGDSGYYGLRRYPYSTDRTKNDLSFRHISSGEPLPVGVPTSGLGSPDNAEVHNAGEIWAAMVFEAYAALLGDTPRLTFEDARRRLADYIVLGMQLAPADPTFTEQRDALLAAAAAADATDFQLMAAAFASRGAGTCAASPPRSSTDLVGVVEDFTLSGLAVVESITVDDDVTSCDGDGVLDAGETGTLRIVVRNAGGATLSGTTVNVSSTGPGLRFPAGAGATLPATAAFASSEVLIPVAAMAPLQPATWQSLSVQVVDAAMCSGPVAAQAEFLLEADAVASATDTMQMPVPSWAPDGSAGVWAHVGDPAGPANRLWHGVDFASPADASLVSPELVVSPVGSFVVGFTHRHSFEVSGGTWWDGGVVEYSTDGGGSWTDVAALTTPGYGGTLITGGSNPLAGRQAYVGTNPSWPATDAVVLDFGTSLAGQTVRLRFRIGTDAAVGDHGWEIDDVAVQGITNLPFTQAAPEADGVCPLFADGFDVSGTAPWSGAQP